MSNAIPGAAPSAGNAAPADDQRAALTKALQFYADGLQDDGSVARVALWAMAAQPADSAAEPAADHIYDAVKKADELEQHAKQVLEDLTAVSISAAICREKASAECFDWNHRKVVEARQFIQYWLLPFLAAHPPPPAAQAQARPTDDHLWDETLSDRDRYHEMADKLAGAIAVYLGLDIGEHSNMNCPWEEALEAIECATQIKDAQAQADHVNGSVRLVGQAGEVALPGPYCRVPVGKLGEQKAEAGYTADQLIAYGNSRALAAGASRQEQDAAENCEGKY